MDSTARLLRQVHPTWVQNGRVTSQAFRPTPKDENMLSVYDGDLIAAQESWTHFTVEQRLQSVGVLAVTVGECTAMELPVQADPATFAEHALIDFRNLGGNVIKKKGDTLAGQARARGWLYQAPTG